MRRFILLLFAFLILTPLNAQTSLLAPEKTIEWKTTVRHSEDNVYKLIFTGKILEGWHTYGPDHEFSPTTIEFGDIKGMTLKGEPYEISAAADYQGEKVFFNEIILGQDVVMDGERAFARGTVSWRSCDDTRCASPEYYDFYAAVKKENTSPEPAKADSGTVSPAQGPEDEEGGNGFDWALIIEAILWGLGMLLTPCVFPMVPMTVSFFLKSSSNAAAGRFKASMYGLFIVLLYTVPISIIILSTRIIGGAAVTADIFNWLATHWLPNILFFLIFMVFAASFFGAFEITLPSSLVNKSDKGTGKKGLIGVFFMALTLVLVSFSCTGPIVSSVLIKSTRGEFWMPMVTMLAFSIAFALPFTILAMFPTLMQKLPRSGSWLNSIKVVFGFIEVAFGFKFLSVADQTYHWGLLDREVYLAIWIVVFTLLGFYLIGKIRFANDDKLEYVSVKRLTLAIAVFSFVVYMIPGMFGAPLKALSGYLPPITTQDFVLGDNTTVVAFPGSSRTGRTDMKLPLGLTGYFSLEEGLEAAREAGKPVFVDITGHGCVNCREMESKVWSDPAVLDMLKNDFIIVALYTDDKKRLPEDEWIKAENGDMLKDLGRVNSYIARTKFNVSAQPGYALLSPDDELLVPVRGYDLDIDGFIAFLQSGLDAYAASSAEQ